MGRNIRKLSLLFAFVAIVAGMYSLCNRVGGYVTPKENSVEVVKKVDEVSTTTPTTVLTTVPTTKTKVNKTNKETVPTTSSGKNYPVIEKQFGEDGITYDNFCVKNYTDFSLDIATELKRGLPFKIEKNHQVQVLIFHTHTCESYLKSDTDSISMYIKHNLNTFVLFHILLYSIVTSVIPTVICQVTIIQEQLIIKKMLQQ